MEPDFIDSLGPNMVDGTSISRAWVGGLAAVAFVSAGLYAGYGTGGRPLSHVAELLGSHASRSPVTAPDAEANEPDGPDGGSLDAGGASAQLPEELRDPDHIAVFTMNLQTGFTESADIEKRTRIVVDYVREHRPDLVGLQEVSNSSDYRHRKKIFERRTDYRVVYKKTHDIPYFYEEGLAILSRWPVKDSRIATTLPYQGVGTVVTPAIITAVAYQPSRRIQMFNTHLIFSPSDQKKTDQALEVLNFVRAHRRDVPTFVVGDMNARPQSRAMKLLRGEAAVDGVRGDFVDAWGGVRPEDPGLTSPAPEMTKRIDYIYYLPPEGDVAARSCRRVFEEEVDGIRPSDHLGVWCEFELARDR